MWYGLCVWVCCCKDLEAVLAETDGAIERDRLQVIKRALRIFLGIQQLRMTVFGVTMLVEVTSVLFLQMPGVWQQNLTQIAGTRGAVHATLEAVSYQQRQVAAVVNVGVG